jgi:HEAT repeat protein
MEIILQIGNPPLDPFISGLKDADESVRRNSAWALGESGETQAVNALIESLNDEDSSVRSTAANSLGKIGDIIAVRPLEAMLGDMNNEVRSSAAAALGTLGDHRAVPQLIRDLGDWDWHVRANAATILGQLKDNRAVPMLIVTLGDDASEVSTAALKALKAFDVICPEVMNVALRSMRKDVRLWAVKVLRDMRDPSAVDVLKSALKDEDDDVYNSVAEALRVHEFGLPDAK